MSDPTTCDAVRECAGDGCQLTATQGRLCASHAYLRYDHRPLKGANARWTAALAFDVDAVTVERLVAGEYVESFTSFERREAVRLLRCDGFSYPRIAQRVGIHETQVWRDLARLGLVGQKGQQR